MRVLAALAAFAAMAAIPTAGLAAGSLNYRGQCPTPMNLVDSEAYFCRTMGHDDLGKRVEAAYQAQRRHLREIYGGPADAEKLTQELAVLQAGQTGWEAYIANQCAAEGYMAWGGTLEPKLVGECAQRLAEARIKELEMLVEGLGN